MLLMIKGILNGILKMIISVLNIFLIPVNALFENLFPDMTISINTFVTFVNTYVGGFLSYFFSILPPTFRGILVIWLTFIVAYYTIHYVYIGIVKVFDIIQKIKFW